MCPFCYAVDLATWYVCTTNSFLLPLEQVWFPSWEHGHGLKTGGTTIAHTTVHGEQQHIYPENQV